MVLFESPWDLLSGIWNGVHLIYALLMFGELCCFDPNWGCCLVLSVWLSCLVPLQEAVENPRGWFSVFSLRWWLKCVLGLLSLVCLWISPRFMF